MVNKKKLNNHRVSIFTSLFVCLITCMFTFTGSIVNFNFRKTDGIGSAASKSTSGTFLVQMIELDKDPNTRYKNQNVAEWGENRGPGAIPGNRDLLNWWDTRSGGSLDPVVDGAKITNPSLYNERYGIVGTFGKDITDNFYMIDDWHNDSNTKKSLAEIPLALRISFGEFGNRVLNFLEGNNNVTMSIQTAGSQQPIVIPFISPTYNYTYGDLFGQYSYTSLTIPYNYIQTNTTGLAVDSNNQVVVAPSPIYMTPNSWNSNLALAYNNQGELVWRNPEDSSSEWEAVLVSSADGTFRIIGNDITYGGQVMIPNYANNYEVVSTTMSNNRSRLVLKNAPTVDGYLNPTYPYYNYEISQSVLKRDTLPEGIYTISIGSHAFNKDGNNVDISEPGFALNFNLLKESSYFEMSTDSNPEFAGISKAPTITGATLSRLMTEKTLTSDPSSYEAYGPGFDAQISVGGINASIYQYTESTVKSPSLTFDATKFWVDISTYSFGTYYDYSIKMLKTKANLPGNLELTRQEKNEYGVNVGDKQTKIISFTGEMIKFDLANLGSYSITYRTIVLSSNGSSYREQDIGAFNQLLRLNSVGFESNYAHNRTDSRKFYKQNGELTLDSFWANSSAGNGLARKDSAATESANVTEAMSDETKDLTKKRGTALAESVVADALRENGKVVRTNQGPVWFNFVGDFITSSSWKADENSTVYYKPTGSSVFTAAFELKKDTLLGTGTVKDINGKDVRLGTGVYVVIVKYSFGMNGDVDNNSVIVGTLPVDIRGITETLYFAFDINNTNPEVVMQRETSGANQATINAGGGTWINLAGGGYTNSTVKIETKLASVFDAAPSYTFVQKGFDGVQRSNGNIFEDTNLPTTTYDDRVTRVFYVDPNIYKTQPNGPHNGHYVLTLKWGTGVASLKQDFFIDTTPINLTPMANFKDTGENFFAVSNNTYSVPYDFKLGWENKLSKAGVSAVYAFTYFETDFVIPTGNISANDALKLSQTIVKDGSGLISSTKRGDWTKSNENVSQTFDDIWVRARYKLGDLSTTYVPYTRDTRLNKAGIYSFKVTDDAGNETFYYIVVDKDLTPNVVYIEDVLSEGTGPGGTIKFPEDNFNGAPKVHNVVWGDYKVIPLGSTSLSSTTFLADNIDNGMLKRNRLNSYVPLTDTSPFYYEELFETHGSYTYFKTKLNAIDGNVNIPTDDGINPRTPSAYYPIANLTEPAYRYDTSRHTYEPQFTPTFIGSTASDRNVLTNTNYFISLNDYADIDGDGKQEPILGKSFALTDLSLSSEQLANGNTFSNRRLVSPAGFWVMEVKANEGTFFYSVSDSHGNKTSSRSFTISFDLSGIVIQSKNINDNPVYYGGETYPRFSNVPNSVSSRDLVNVAVKNFNGPSFTVESISYEFYNKDPQTHWYSANRDINQNLYTLGLDSGVGSLDFYEHLDNGADINGNSINKSGDTTKEGKYVVNRKYTDDFVSPIDLDGEEVDTIERSYSFAIDRANIISYANDVEKNFKLILQNYKEFSNFVIENGIEMPTDLSLDSNLLPIYVYALRNKYNYDFEKIIETLQKMSEEGFTTSADMQELLNEKEAVSRAIFELNQQLIEKMASKTAKTDELTLLELKQKVLLGKYDYGNVADFLADVEGKLLPLDALAMRDLRDSYIQIQREIAILDDAMSEANLQISVLAQNKAGHEADRDVLYNERNAILDGTLFSGTDRDANAIAYASDKYFLISTQAEQMIAQQIRMRKADADITAYSASTSNINSLITTITNNSINTYAAIDTERAAIAAYIGFTYPVAPGTTSFTTRVQNYLDVEYNKLENDPFNSSADTNINTVVGRINTMKLLLISLQLDKAEQDIYKNELTRRAQLKESILTGTGHYSQTKIQSLYDENITDLLNKIYKSYDISTLVELMDLEISRRNALVANPVMDIGNGNTYNFSSGEGGYTWAQIQNIFKLDSANFMSEMINAFDSAPNLGEALYIEYERRLYLTQENIIVEQVTSLTKYSDESEDPENPKDTLYAGSDPTYGGYKNVYDIKNFINSSSSSLTTIRNVLSNDPECIPESVVDKFHLIDSEYNLIGGETLFRDSLVKGATSDKTVINSDIQTMLNEAGGVYMTANNYILDNQRLFSTADKKDAMANINNSIALKRNAIAQIEADTAAERESIADYEAAKAVSVGQSSSNITLINNALSAANSKYATTEFSHDGSEEELILAVERYIAFNGFDMNPDRAAMIENELEMETLVGEIFVLTQQINSFENTEIHEKVAKLQEINDKIYKLEVEEGSGRRIFESIQNDLLIAEKFNLLIGINAQSAGSYIAPTHAAVKMDHNGKTAYILDIEYLVYTYTPTAKYVKGTASTVGGFYVEGLYEIILKDNVDSFVLLNSSYFEGKPTATKPKQGNQTNYKFNLNSTAPNAGYRNSTGYDGNDGDEVLRDQRVPEIIHQDLQETISEGETANSLYIALSSSKDVVSIMPQEEDIIFTFDDPLTDYEARIEALEASIEITRNGALMATPTLSYRKIAGYNANRYFFPLDVKTEGIYSITVQFEGDQKHYTRVDGSSFYKSNFKIVVDANKPEGNLSNLVSADEFLKDYLNIDSNNPAEINSSIVSTLNEFGTNEIARTLRAYAFKVNGNFEFTKTTTNKYAGINSGENAVKYSPRLDSYKLFYRPVTNTIAGGIDYSLYSLLPDDNESLVANANQHLSFSEGNPEYIKLAYGTKLNTIMSESGYYEIIEIDEAGNHRGYFIYLALMTESPTLTLSYHNRLALTTGIETQATGGYRKGTFVGNEGDYTINAIRVQEGNAPNYNFTVDSLVTNDKWFKITVLNKITGSTSTMFSDGSLTKSLMMAEIKDWIETTCAYTNGRGEAYLLTIQNRLGQNSSINININFARSAEIAWTNLNNSPTNIIVGSDEYDSRATFVKTFRVDKVISFINATQIFLDSQNKTLAATSGAQYVLDSGVYKFVQTDNYGRTNTYLISNKATGALDFVNTIRHDDVAYAKTNVNFEYQPLLYRVEFYVNTYDGQGFKLMDERVYISSSRMNNNDVMVVQFVLQTEMKFEIQARLTSIVDSPIITTSCVYDSTLPTVMAMTNSTPPQEQNFTTNGTLRTSYARLAFDFSTDPFHSRMSGAMQYILTGSNGQQVYSPMINLGANIASGRIFNTDKTVIYLTVTNDLGFSKIYTIYIEFDYFAVYRVVDGNSNTLKQSVVIDTYSQGTFYSKEYDKYIPLSDRVYDVVQYFTIDSNYKIETNQSKQTLRKDEILNKPGELPGTKTFLIWDTANTSFKQIIKVTYVPPVSTLTGLTLNGITISGTNGTNNATNNNIRIDKDGVTVRFTSLTIGSNYNSKGNYNYVDVYYNDQFVASIGHDTEFINTFNLSEAGTYTLIFRDLAGNRHQIGGTSQIKVYIITDALLIADSANYHGLALPQMVYENSVTLNVENADLLDAAGRAVFTNLSIKGYYNGEQIPSIEAVSKLELTDVGFYDITVTYTIQGSTRSTRYTFFLIDPNISRLGLVYYLNKNISINGAMKYSSSASEDESGQNILGEILSNYGKSSIVLTSRSFQTGRFSITILAQFISSDSSFNYKPDITYTFNVFISNETPLVATNVNYGTTSTKNIQLSYNPGQIFASNGNVSIVVYTISKAGENVGEKVMNQQVQITAGMPNEYVNMVEISEAGEYFIEIRSADGIVLSKNVITKKDPLTMGSILLIIAGGVLTIGGVVLFLVLRNKMKVR